MENKGKLLPLCASLDDQNTAINTSLMGDRSFVQCPRLQFPTDLLQSSLAACHQQGQRENL